MTLKEFLRAASKEQRQEVADAAGTSVGYLYQLAGGHRRNPGTHIALGIESATKKLNQRCRGVPVVTVESLAQL
jgi:hypothetical protein